MPRIHPRLRTDPDVAARARTLQEAALVYSVILPVALLVRNRLLPLKPRERAAFLLTEALLVISLRQLGRGKLTSSTASLVTALYLLILVGAIEVGGYHAPIVTFMIFFPAIVTSVGGPRLGAYQTALSLLGLAGIWFLSRTGRVKLDRLADPMLHTDVAFAMYSFTLLSLAAAVHSYERNQRIAADELRRREQFEDLQVIAAGISHELGNPLTVLKLTRQLTRTSSEVDRRIDQAIDRIDRIAADLKYYSSNGQRVPRKEFVLSCVVEETLERIRPELESAGVELRYTFLADRAVRVLGSPSDLSQALLGLLRNGKDALESLPDGWIHVKVREVDAGVEICVIDSGPGVRPSQVHRLGTPFFTTRAPAHKGLGLSFVARVARDHGGESRYEPKARNTTFVLWIPARAKRAAA
jgi:two-component system sensor histidine kinase RegB